MEHLQFLSTVHQVIMSATAEMTLVADRRPLGSARFVYVLPYDKNSQWVLILWMDRGPCDMHPSGRVFPVPSPY